MADIRELRERFNRRIFQKEYVMAARIAELDETGELRKKIITILKDIVAQDRAHDTSGTSPTSTEESLLCHLMNPGFYGKVWPGPT